MKIFVSCSQRLVLVVAATGLAAFANTRCSSAPPPAATEAPALVIRGAGSTFSSLLFSQWATAYHQLHPEIAVRYDAVGSGEGVRRFMGRDVQTDQVVEFGASDSAMSDAQLAQVPDTLMLPVTGGCVTVAYNVPGLHGLQLSRSAYAGIFAGTIDRWNAAEIAATNPGRPLPDLPVARIVRQDSSGTTFAFSSHLAVISDSFGRRSPPGTLVDWPGEAMRANGNEGVAGMIKKYDGAIGYVGFEFAHRLGLDVAALQNRAGSFVAPSEAACRAGLASAQLPANLRVFVTDPAASDAYPIVTFSWALLRKSAGGQLPDAVRTFFHWVLTDGQRYSSQFGYVQLPALAATKGLEALGSSEADAVSTNTR
jgi:phosphate transport system substrate-binding protein